MKAFHNLAGAARKRLFRRSVKQEASQMDAAARTALVDDLSPATALQTELEQIEAEIATARNNLKQSEEKEIFLGQRSRQYRKALDERARQLKEEQALLDAQQKAASSNGDEAVDDEEMAAQIELDKKMEKWERDEDALTSIVETHKKILGHNETMRWRLKELEAKRQSCRSMIAECTDFLDAAEDVRNQINQEAEQAIADEQARQAQVDPMIQIITDEPQEHEDDDDAEDQQGAENAETQKLQPNV